NAVFMSPIKQLKSGIPLQDIKCKTGYTLLIKPSNDHPSCVKPTSVTRLVSHSWITPEKFQTTYSVKQQNSAPVPKDINTQFLDNSTAKNVTNQSITIKKGINKISNQSSIDNATAQNMTESSFVIPNSLSSLTNFRYVATDDKGNFYSSTADNIIKVNSLTGENWIIDAYGPNKPISPQGIAVDKAGNIYVIDLDTNSIK